MACSIIQGNEINCRDSVGGVKTIYIANYSNVQAYVEDASGTISSITMVPGTRFYTFNLEKENATYENKSTGNLDAGTNFYDSTVTFTMKKMSASMKYSIKVLAQAQLVVIVKDNNDLLHVVGIKNAADCLETVATTGKAFGDMNGATLTITSKSGVPDGVYTGSISTITA